MTYFPLQEYKNYKHFQTESFGDKKKVTEELLKQLSLNEEYLFKRVNELFDLSDPVTTKHFIDFLDETKSFGIASSSITVDGKTRNYYHMDSTPQLIKIIDFNTDNDDSNRYDESWIDEDSSDVEFYNDGSNYGARIKQEIDTIITHKPKTITQKTVKTGKTVLSAYNHGAYEGLTSPNGHWYVGYDINKNYRIKEKWKKNPHSYNIPSVCRAMTFKADTTGIVEKVNIGVMTDSTTKHKMYVEIRTVDNKGYPTKKVLARSSLHFTHKSNTVKTFTFKKGAEVQKGQTYAVVMKSPLSSQYQTYRLVGWQKMCYKNWKAFTKSDKAKNSGYSFGSNNNGKTWTKYLSKSGASGYKSAKNVPISFGYEVYIKPTTVATSSKTVTIDETNYYNYYPKGNNYLYLKVPTTSPIRSFQLSVEDEKPTGTSISYEISQNNREWISIEESYYDEESSGAIGELFTSRPTFLWLRCNLQTTNVSVTPVVKKITVNLGLTYAQHSYLRSDYYIADQSTMLSSCIWSNVDADIENHNANIEVDLIREKETTETFYIRNPNVENLGELITEYADITVSTDEDVVNYIEDNQEFLNYLKEQNIYVIGYVTELELQDYPSYPITEASIRVDDIILSADDCHNWDYSNPTRPVYNLPFNIQNCLNEINLSKNTDEGLETLTLYGGEDFSTKIDSEKDNSRYADYIYDSENNTLTFNLSNSVFKQNCSIVNNRINGFLNSYTDLNICVTQLNYAEWLDYTIGDETGNYNDKKIVWKTDGYSLIEGDLKVTFNPLFARNISLPLKLDLWIETFDLNEITDSIELKGYAVDSIRNFETGTIENDEFIEDNIEYLEGIDYVVDYQNKKVTFVTEMPNNKYLRIKYTPNLTDNSLALAYRLDRDSETKDCYIFEQRFSTRT